MVEKETLQDRHDGALPPFENGAAIFLALFDASAAARTHKVRHNAKEIMGRFSLREELDPATAGNGRQTATKVSLSGC
jgi:hypothetical protein